MVEIAVALVTQFGVICAALVAAFAARGAKNAAHGARTAARRAEASGGTDHTEHTNRLDQIARTLGDIVRDMGGLRSEGLQTRAEVHDLRRGVEDVRTQLSTHLQEKRP